jgi:uncharacterized protein (DUF362 family)
MTAEKPNDSPRGKRTTASEKPAGKKRRAAAATQPAKAAAKKKRAEQKSPAAATGGASPALPPKTRAVIVQEKGADKYKLLESALEQAGFWRSVDEARQVAALAPENFRLLIKPDLALFDEGSSTGTDPELVEHLIDLLRARGYGEVAVGEGRNSFDLWLENRDVLVLAEMVGYKFITRQGHNYDVVDLSEGLIDVSYPKGSALAGTGLARPWVEAHYRISFAKNKTDEEQFYALGLNNLLGVLPLRDKDYHYQHRLKPWDVCVDLLRRTPVHFSIIDAVVSNHGSAGSRVPRPLETDTVIACADLLLADWAAAIKMGLDPHASLLNSKALHEIGLPVAYEIAGDQSPYEGWINVHPLVADSVRKRNEWTTVSRAVKPWLQPVNPELFPFKDAVNERVNALASRYFSQVDDNPAAFWTTVGLNYWFGAVHKSIEAMRVLYRKDSLQRIEASLNIDLAQLSLSDYESIVAYLEPLAELIGNVAPDANGLRWRYLDGSVLFEFSRVIPAPYDDFVSRVDISKAIEFMNDYIGGVAVPVAHDEAGRVTHQAERNLYLTQPNYLVLYDGKAIDVTKLEHVTYAKDVQKIFWKTIKSENNSAAFDDGIVTFARTDDGETHVTVFGRQQFTLPLFWQAVNLDLNPLLKDFLVTYAYTNFFTRTLANFEAKYEGRDIRIGRAWNPVENEPDFESGVKTPTERLTEVVEKVNRVGEIVNQHLGGVLKKLPWKSQPSVTAAATHVDEEGFSHFKPETASVGAQAPGKAQTDRPNARGFLKKAGVGTLGFLNDLNKAMQKDGGTYRDDD